MVEEIIYQEHTYEIVKVPDVGFGIAISGGRDNPGVQSGDPAIIISDVVRHGPAFGQLKINDTVLRVNNNLTYGMTHQQAVRELKNAGKRVEITVKRKAVVHVQPRRTPSPGAMRRSKSRDLDDLPRGGRGRRRGSRDWSPKGHRSRSRGSAYHRSRSRGRDTSRSRSRSRGRSHSRRSHSRASRHSNRSPSSSSRSPSPPRKSRSPERRSRRGSRERSRSRGRHRSVSRGRSSRSSSRSITPPRTLHKQKSVGELRSLSPLSPDPAGAKPDGDVMVFPVKPSEMRPVVLKKTRWNNSYGLKLGTRIFIQDIQPGSLADKNPELKRGDTIMMINGRNVDNKDVQEAIQIIGLSKDKLTMLVKSEDGGTVSIPASQLTTHSAEEKKRPKEKAPVEDNASSYSHRSSPSRGSAHSEASKKSDKKHEKKADKPRHEPEAEKKPNKKTIGGVQVMPAVIATAAKEKAKPRYPESISSRSSSQPSHTPEPAPRAKAVHPVKDQPLYDVPPSDEEGHILPHDAHTVSFVKGRNVGIRLAGGNDVGIFVASVQEGSPAAKQGLKMGDQILSVNDQNFRDIIREEAVLALMGLPDGQEATIVAQPKPDVYQKVLEHGTGDSFYIRTHFKYERANEHEMSFKQGSVFRISDTLYQGMVGYWLAVRIGRGNMEIERGVVPNGSRAQQLKEVQDRKVTLTKENAGLRGGIKRRLKGNQGKGKPEKPVTTASGPQFPAYERVVLREAGFKRPVVIFGPLADIARQRLASDYPPNYQIASNDGIISGQKSNRKGIIRLNAIKEIIEKDKHAILDITPAAVEKLNYAQLYPIVVFLKPESKGAVKELRNKLAVTEEEKKKKHGKLYDRAVKMQKGYGHVFTDTIPLGTVSDDWYRKLHSTIKDQQNMPVWVSEDKLGAASEEDHQGMVIPGDDDALSYVSAPASDYSVTTVGSEMLHSMADMDDEEELNDHNKSGHHAPPIGGVALLPPIRRQPSSTSSSEEGEEAGGRFGDDDLDDALKEDLEEEPPAVKPVPPSTRENVKHAASPRVVDRPPERTDYASSTSSEEHRPPPTRALAPVAVTPVKATEQPRGHQSMPEGRFDPDSFLKNHIKRLNKVRSEDDTPPPPEARPEPVMSPRHAEPPQPGPQPSVVPKRAPEFEATNRFQPPASTRFQPDSNQQQSYTRRDVPNAEPVYAQVDKGRRPPPQSEYQPQSQRSTGGYGDRRPPVHSEPQPQPQAQPQRPSGGYGDGYRKPSENTYNRFAGNSNPSLPPKTNLPPRSNAYKGYTPRPYNKVTGPTGPPRMENGPSKDHMYDSGVDTHEKTKIFPQSDNHAAGSLPTDNEDPQVVATARGVFDHDGGVLSSVETGVSIMIPKGAIPPGVRQEIYFKVCKDNTVLPPLDKGKGETLLSPLVMCGPHGLQFNHPVELRLPHCASLTPDGWSFSLKSSDTRFPGEPSQWQNMNMPSDGGYQVSSNSVSVLIDHF